MLEFTNSDFALEFDRISDDLVGFIDQAYQELEVATRSYQQASEVAEKVVVASIGLSVAIAIFLAVLTGRAIAHPIQSLTSFAIRTTEESNFELQATVEQDDEIGMLANAFNQLIRAVKQLLQQQKTANEQLENYSQTLESQVEVRTQELSDKNTQLQQLLEELQHTQVQMVQSEKMSALGQMVAGVAHEINNPVNFIHGNLSHVQEYTHNLLGLVQLYQNYYPDPAPEMQADRPKRLIWSLSKPIGCISLWRMCQKRVKMKKLVKSSNKYKANKMIPSDQQQLKAHLKAVAEILYRNTIQPS